MRQTIVLALLWFSALGCGLLAGLFFAFSAFIMTALGRVDRAAGIPVMNAINAVIVRSPFMPIFIGTTVSGAALVLIGALHWFQPGGVAMAAGGLVHLLGMFGVTLAFNVPLNDALAAVEPSAAEADPVWRRYLKDWTAWNHVRTLACLAASACFIWALAVRQA